MGETCLGKQEPLIKKLLRKILLEEGFQEDYSYGGKTAIKKIQKGWNQTNNGEK